MGTNSGKAITYAADISNRIKKIEKQTSCHYLQVIGWSTRYLPIVKTISTMDLSFLHVYNNYFITHAGTYNHVDSMIQWENFKIVAEFKARTHKLSPHYNVDGRYFLDTLLFPCNQYATLQKVHQSERRRGSKFCQAQVL